MNTDFRLGPIFDDTFSFDDTVLDNRYVQIPPLQDPFPREALARPWPLEPSKVAQANHPSSNAFLKPKLQPPEGNETKTARVGALTDSNVDKRAETQTARVIEQSAGKELQTAASAPLAEVLNDATDADPQSSTQLQSSSSNQRKRRRSQSKGVNEYLQLPKPPVPKNEKPLRIPPLLQGLHEPPPNAALFPPITTTASFQDLGTIKDTTSPPLQSDKTTENVGKEERKEKRKSKERPSNAYTNPNTNRKKTRKQWTNEETRVLLKAVARFGVGKWKKILSHPEYKFNGRSAVDLRDRFRTCRPEDYMNPSEMTKPQNGLNRSGDKPSSTAAKGESSVSVSSLLVSKTAHDVADTTTTRPRNSRCHRKDDAELAALGIRSPFVKSNRRERQVFSEEEDVALVRGYERYGASWADICKDPVFSSHRRPRDLRDRFRHKFPDKYKRSGRSMAGRKFQPDNEQTEKQEQKVQVAPNGVLYDPVRTPSSGEKLPTVVNALASKPAGGNNAAPGMSNSALLSQQQPVAMLPPPLSPLHPSYFPDILFEDPFTHGDSREAETVAVAEAYSNASAPVVLDRSIFEWATQNNSAPAVLDSNTITTQTLRGNSSSNAPVLPIEYTPRFVDPLVTWKPASGLF